jgi:hypothetical protein
MKKLSVLAVLMLSIVGLSFGALNVMVTPLGVELAWDPPAVITSLAGYNLYRSDVAGGPYTKLGTAQPMVPYTTQVYTDSTVVCGHTYYYDAKGVGYCDAGFVESGYSNEVQAVVTWIPPPPIMRAPVVQGSNVYLQWQSPPAEMFRVFRAGSPSGLFSEIAQTAALGYVDKVQPRQPAAYKVAAVGCGGQAESNIVLKPSR